MGKKFILILGVMFQSCFSIDLGGKYNQRSFGEFKLEKFKDIDPFESKTLIADFRKGKYKNYNFFEKCLITVYRKKGLNIEELKIKIDVDKISDTEYIGYIQGVYNRYLGRKEEKIVINKVPILISNQNNQINEENDTEDILYKFRILDPKKDIDIHLEIKKTNYPTRVFLFKIYFFLLLGIQSLCCFITMMRINSLENSIKCSIWMMASVIFIDFFQLISSATVLPYSYLFTFLFIALFYLDILILGTMKRAGGSREFSKKNLIYHCKVGGLVLFFFGVNLIFRVYFKVFYPTMLWIILPLGFQVVYSFKFQKRKLSKVYFWGVLLPKIMSFLYVYAYAGNISQIPIYWPLVYFTFVVLVLEFLLLIFQEKFRKLETVRNVRKIF